jgi:hypothetical protein
LTSDAAGTGTWQAAGGANHNLLSTTHLDTLVDSVLAGDLLIGNATPKWARLAKGIQDQVLAMGVSLPNWVTTLAVGAIPNLDTAKITTGRFGMARMPDGTSGYFLKAQGWGVDPIYAAVTATPGGSDTQVQFNDVGILGGDSKLTWNKVNGLLTVLETGKELLGNLGTDTSPWNTVTGGDLLEIGRGTSSNPTTSKKATLYVEKWVINAEGNTVGDQGAGHFKAIKVVGAACNLSALTVTGVKNGGTGSVIGAHIRVTGGGQIGVTNGIGSYYGIWAMANYYGPKPSTEIGHLAAMECNVIDSNTDSGHLALMSTGVASTAIWIWNGESVAPGTVALAVCQSTVKWHTGLAILLDSILPLSSSRNEAIWIQGGSSAVNAYVGIKMENYLQYGIDMYQATCSGGAIRFPDGSIQNVAAGGGGAPINATYVCLSTDATLTQERVLVGTANQVIVTDGGAGANVTLSTPQNIHTGANPTFAGLNSTDPINLNNNTSVRGKDTGGVLRHLISVGSDNVVIVGYAAQVAIVLGFYSPVSNPVNIWVNGALKNVQIDVNGFLKGV